MMVKGSGFVSERGKERGIQIIVSMVPLDDDRNDGMMMMMMMIAIILVHYGCPASEHEIFKPIRQTTGYLTLNQIANLNIRCGQSMAADRRVTGCLADHSK